MDFSAVLFDFDGTIVDSSAGIYNGLRYAFAAYALPIPNEDVLKKFIGPPLLDSFRDLFHMEDAEAEKMIAKYREYYDKTGWKEIRVYDGIETILQRLSEKGVRLGTASTKPQVFVQRILEHVGLASYFSYFGGTRFGKNPGTKTEIIQRGVEELQSTNETTLMVGDRKYDIIGAKEAGVPVAAVLYGFGNVEEFEAYGADFILEDTASLEKFLLKD